MLDFRTESGSSQGGDNVALTGSCVPTSLDSGSVPAQLGAPILSHIMYQLMSFRRSAPPQNRQLDNLISDCK